MYPSYLSTGNCLSMAVFVPLWGAFTVQFYRVVTQTFLLWWNPPVAPRQDKAGFLRLNHIVSCGLATVLVEACRTGTEGHSLLQLESDCSDCVISCVSTLDVFPVNFFKLAQNTDYSLLMFPCEANPPAPRLKFETLALQAGRAPCTCHSFPKADLSVVKKSRPVGWETFRLQAVRFNPFGINKLYC